MKRASLKKRVMAYIIDMFIVGMIISIISLGYNSNNSRLDNLNKELDDVTSSYVNREITDMEYINAVSGINYDINKVNIVSNTLYVVVCIGYFVMFQYLNDGASIGKKFMHIKIVNKDKKRVSLFKIFIRTSIVDDIIPTILTIILLYLTKGITYMSLCGIINFLSFVYIIICIITIKKRKDNLAINDIMSGSYVIEE